MALDPGIPDVGPRPALSGVEGAGAKTQRTHDDQQLLEIPYAIRWLVPNGERFVNFDIINDNDSQLAYWRRFGHIYAVGIPTKKWRLVVVSDAELLDEVADNEDQFGKRVDDINFFQQLEGSRGGGIPVLSDSERYRHIRRVMLPWYASSHQKTQFVRMKDLAKQMTATWSSFPATQTVDMRDWMQRYALEVSGRGACNYDFGLLGGEPPKSPLGQAVLDVTKESIARIAEPRPGGALLPGTTARSRTTSYRQQQKLLRETAEALVRGRLNTCPLGQQTDLLTRLVSTADPVTGEPLDPDTIRDQILMHFSNGFNGPSIIGAWLAYVLATHADVEQRLVAEIDSICAGDPNYELQYDDLMRLPYMTQVIKETLRIYPPMPVTIRRSKKDGALGRYRVRKDDIILIGTLAAQRDPRYWGDEADVFDPEQFDMNKVVGRPRHAFIPFSVGPRQCIAQEVTFMMLRIVLFEIYRNFRLRLAPGAVVFKNTVATTKPTAVPVLLARRETAVEQQPLGVTDASSGRNEVVGDTPSSDWDRPSEIPPTSAFRHLVIAYGSNFGSCKALAERFAKRGDIYGFSCEVIPLNDLVQMPSPTQPWLLVVVTSTYTGNPPANAVEFNAWLERSTAGAEMWRQCRYLVFGVGNTQWNAFLAFPRYVHQKLTELGANAVAPLAFSDVGSPAADAAYESWNERTWPALIELAGAHPSDTAASRVDMERSAQESFARTDSNAAMALSRDGQIITPQKTTNAAGIATVEAEVLACRELQSAQSPRSTRHLELRLPDGVLYAAGDHLGVCPQNDVEAVRRLSRLLDASLDGVFVVPASMAVHVVPRGIPLQVRNVLNCLVDIAGKPGLPLVELSLTKAVSPSARTKLAEIRDILLHPEGARTPLRTFLDTGGYDPVRLLEEFRSCSVTLFEFLQVAQPLRPRYYSTSSSPQIHGAGVVHLSVGGDDRPIDAAPDLSTPGMCSRYLRLLRPGDRVNVFVDQAQGFHLQDNLARPMIFVSAGSGFAPIRAFLWERMAARRRGQVLGEAALFNGIRSTRLDYIYRDEIEALADHGVLDHVLVAASREITGRRDYVQGRIVEQSALVWRLIRQDAHVYVCGSRAMRSDVRGTFVAVIADEGGMSRAAAEDFIVSLEAEGRYRSEVWG